MSLFCLLVYQFFCVFSCLWSVEAENHAFIRIPCRRGRVRSQQALVWRRSSPRKRGGVTETSQEANKQASSHSNHQKREYFLRNINKQKWGSSIIHSSTFFWIFFKNSAARWLTRPQIKEPIEPLFFFSFHISRRDFIPRGRRFFPSDEGLVVSPSQIMWLWYTAPRSNQHTAGKNISTLAEL